MKRSSTKVPKSDKEEFQKENMKVEGRKFFKK